MTRDPALTTGAQTGACVASFSSVDRSKPTQYREIVNLGLALVMQHKRGFVSPLLDVA
jgi:hypothetical protein